MALIKIPSADVTTDITSFTTDAPRRVRESGFALVNTRDVISARRMTTGVGNGGDEWTVVEMRSGGPVLTTLTPSEIYDLT